MNDTADGGGRRKRLVVLIVVLVVLIAAAAAGAAVLATRDSDETKERAFKANAVTGFIVIEGSKVTAAGTYSGSPGG